MVTPKSFQQMTLILGTKLIAANHTGLEDVFQNILSIVNHIKLIGCAHIELQATVTAAYDE